MPAFDRDSTPIANASDHDFKGERTTLYLFQFGAYGTQYVYAWGTRGVESALEEAAGWLADNAPGHFVTFSEADYNEAAADIGAPDNWRESEASGPNGDPWRYAVAERAECDHTYTESGHLASWEWYVNDVTDPDEVAYIRWRSLEGVDPDDADDRWASPDHGDEDCLGAVDRAYYPDWWGPANGYHAVNGAADNDTGTDKSYDCAGV